MSAARPWVQSEDPADPGWPLITDIHQLDVLRWGAIVKGGGHEPETYRKEYHVGRGAAGAYWTRFGMTMDYKTREIELPATLLYEPEEWE